jgi:7,8-dihydropterin-6-yl-methyl-4-(beta-D-ribofuranosyl)aminobenzene 5'-phosphate synthase
MSHCIGTRLTVLDENFVDILLPEETGIRRFNMDQHFSSRHGELLAENGFCILVETFTDTSVTRILFDAGLTSGVVLHNARQLSVSLQNVAAVVVSHGHPDHFGGLIGLLDSLDGLVPVILHPEAFNPRMIVKKHITLPMINIGLDEHSVIEAGGRLIAARDSIPLGPGIATSGEMSTTRDFEMESPVGRLCIGEDGHVGHDHINDHQVLGINVENVGLIVVDPCGHRGVVSATDHMVKVMGADKVHAVMGGFHTGHPGTSAERISRTAAALAEMEVEMVAPMHCSGFAMKRAVAEAAPNAFRQLTVGSVLTVGTIPVDGDRPW